jgi:beta-lactamase class A
VRGVTGGVAGFLAEAELRGTEWSVLVRRLGYDEPLLAHGPERLLPTASVGKVFLLVEVAERVVAGTLDPDAEVDRAATQPVADSGLLQHLTIQSLAVRDLAVLVASVSDNWATNLLLDLVGLDSVQARARALAPRGSTLHDRVRDVRGPETPKTLSSGCAADWVEVLTGLHQRRHTDPAADLVLGWLATSVDLSMVASAFGLDPLAHAEDPRTTLRNKTGTDAGVRADVGLVERGGEAFAYAALCRWDPTEADLSLPVLAGMRRIGELVLEY